MLPEYIQEIVFAANQLEEQTKVLSSSEYPLVQWFLLQSLSKSLARNSMQVYKLCQSTLEEIAAQNALVDATEEAKCYVDNRQAG